MFEWPAIAALASTGGFAVSFAVFWLTFGTRIGKAETEATAASSAIKDALDRVSRLGASLSTYREQVARDYIQREAMREVEDRLTAAIDRLGDRLDRFVEAAVHR
jgi:hypothetical protein